MEHTPEHEESELAEQFQAPRNEMDQSQNPQPEAPPEGQTVSHEERVQEAVLEIRQMLEGGDREAALYRFSQLHAVDQGDVLFDLAESPRADLLVALSPDETAEILERMEPEEAAEVSEGIRPGSLAQILELTPPHTAADILQLLPDEHSEQTLQAMAVSHDVVSLLQYRKDTAGGQMTVGYPVVKETVTTPNALDQLRLLGPDAENINSILVVDDDNRLVGSLSMARLALARPTALVGDIADHNVISVTPDIDQEHCARLMQRYDLSQLPVVDRDGRLSGVILAEDIVDVVEEEATEDMYAMVGVAGERVMGPMRSSLRRRLPWLYAYLASALLAALMISLFESTITKVVALAFFLPVVAGQGGIAGSQTLTLVVRSMALGEVPRQLGIRLLLRELTLGLLNGVLLGAVAGAVAFAWKGSPALGLVLGLAMLANLMLAGLAGAGVPLLLRYLRIDPAVSSAVFVITLTDVLGFLLFLALATTFVNFLV